MRRFGSYWWKSNEEIQKYENTCLMDGKTYYLICTNKNIVFGRRKNILGGMTYRAHSLETIKSIKIIKPSFLDYMFFSRKIIIDFGVYNLKIEITFQKEADRLLNVIKRGMNT